MSKLNSALNDYPELFGKDHVDFSFSPTEDFYCDALSSHYLKGYRYTVKKDCELLKELVVDWIDEGKVQIISGDATINGGD